MYHDPASTYSSPPFKDSKFIPIESREESILPASSTGIQDFLRKKAGFDGVQRLDVVPMQVNDWLRVDDAYMGQMQLRTQLLTNSPARVCQVLPAANDSCRELLDTVCKYLTRSFPDQFEYQEGIFTDRYRALTCNANELTGHDALKQVGLIAQEDMLVVRETPQGTFQMVAGLVCFPSRWDLRARIGQELAQIHAEVPVLNDAIGDRIDMLLQKLRANKPMERINFLLYPTDELPLFPDVEMQEYPPFQPEHWFLRSERETFTRLPVSNDVVFTLKTYITALKDLPSQARRLLANMLEEAPETYVSEYKDLDESALYQLLTYLREVNGEESSTEMDGTG